MNNVKRAMENLSRVAGWNTILTEAEVNYWLENYSDLVFCQGRGRRVKFEKITDKNWKVYSEEL